MRITLMLSSCDKLNSLVKVNIQLQTAAIEFVIPQASDGTDSASFSYAINVDSLIHANSSDFDTSKIRSVKIDSITFQLTNADANNNFGNVDNAYAQFYSDSYPYFVTIASVTNNPAINTANLTLPVNSTLELKQYFDAHAFYFTLYNHLRTGLTHDLNCIGKAYFVIQVSP